MRIFKKNRAFTLIELIFAVVIIGVLAGLAIPRFGDTVEKSRIAEAMNILETLRNAQEVYNLENNGNYATVLDDLDVTIPASRNFDVPTVDDVDPIASIGRSGTAYDYTLTIDADGTVKCIGVSPANICAKLGCPAGVCN